MFDFLFGAPYEHRKVARDNFKWGFISTCSVNDGAHPYETAVEHKEYNGGEIVVVEAYDSREDAERGHAKWVKTMTAPDLPSALVDCANSQISQLCAALADKPDNLFTTGAKRTTKRRTRRTNRSAA